MSRIAMKRAFNYSFANLRRHYSAQTVKPTSELAKSTTTVNPNDVSHHESFQDNWWAIDGPVKGLHSFNPLRVQLVRDGLANVGWKEANPGHPLEGLKILDIGCGGGIFAEPLARIGATVTGIDMSSKLIEVAKEHATLDPSLAGRLTYLNTSIEDYSKTNAGLHDAVVASEIIEHVVDQELFLKCCVETLKPGGSIFITTFNKTIPSYIGGILLAEYMLKVIAIGTHQWNKFISPQEVQRILDKYNCRTKLVHGLIYNPIKNQWSWMTSTIFNYALHAIKTE